ncbi:MAG: OsmC family protein [Planctomycetes bacterium]|nr:OsmC family protein [Planctomycetota bacterium]MCP4770873.1 OsmC family protein [Planctomycetota bacterium]MCP4862302.1 OsmC family protein [Planctomycetota bacterium]
MADTFEIHLERVDGFQFRTDFPGTEVAPPIVDEPAPLGTGTGPNPARLLAVAVGNCLSASLLFCLGKSRVEVGGINTTVIGNYQRDDSKRLRIGGMKVTLQIDAWPTPQPTSPLPAFNQTIGFRGWQS